MKLAMALSERSDLQRRLSELSGRLCSNARVQEGEQPAEDPNALLDELNGQTARLEELICRINLTNAATVSDGETLTALLARRDCMNLKLQTMRRFLCEASDLAGRAMRTEIRIRSSVPVPELQKQADSLSKSLRLLDERIQELNWTTELL